MTSDQRRQRAAQNLLNEHGYEWYEYFSQLTREEVHQIAKRLPESRWMGATPPTEPHVLNEVRKLHDHKAFTWGQCRKIMIIMWVRVVTRKAS